MFGVDDAIGGVVGLGTSFAGRLASQGDKQAAFKQNLQALQQWLSINVPDPKQQELYLQHYAQTGTLHPDIEQAIQQGNTKLNNVQVDPQYKQAEMRALNQLSDLGTHGGHTLADDAAYQKSLNDVNAAARGQRGAIAQNFAARGESGSLANELAQLTGTQADTDRLANSSLQTQAQREQRALDAIMQGGQLAGKMQEQDYGMQKDKATSQDAIDRFNTMNQQNVIERNINRQNQAQQQNLETQQNIANKNTDLDNKQQQYNKELLQKQYENEIQKAQGASGQYQNLGKVYQGQAQDTRDTFGGLGSAINQMGSQYSADKRNQDWLDAYKQANGGGGYNAAPLDKYKYSYGNDDEENNWSQYTA